MTDSWTEMTGDSVRRDDARRGAEGKPALFVADEPQHSPEVERAIAKREALRAEELEHLAKLRDRVRNGMDRGDVDLESGTEMLLNISKARCALAGVGWYPGAF